MIGADQWLEGRRERLTWLATASGPWRSWRFHDQPDLVRMVEEAMTTTATPPAEACQGWLGELTAQPTGRRSEADWRRWAASHTRPVVASADSHRRWAWARLDALGQRIEAHERSAWADAVFEDDPEGDSEAATLWAGWFTADPWGGRERWEKLLLKEASRAFRAVCEARRLPQDVRRRVLNDLREGFFWALLGSGGDSQPAWVELALRTLETAGPGPVDALVPLLDEEAWGRIGRCISSRGSWAATVSRWVADRSEPSARAREVARRGGEQQALVEALLDAHVALRVCERWSADPTSAAWGVATQNRGRARGRLRAVLAENPARLMDPLLALPALLHRSRTAVRRFAWSWAWRELAADFAFDAGRAAAPPCLDSGTQIMPFDDDEADAVNTWVLLVLLRGRDGHLERWVRTGGTGDRDSTWARLLTDACPAALVDDPATEGRSRTYRRLRTELSERLPSMRRALLPALQEVAGLPTGRRLRSAFEDRFLHEWSNLVPAPRSGFPTFQRNAKRIAESWSTILSDPASIGEDAQEASPGDPEAP